jgi:hypothetical protein
MNWLQDSMDYSWLGVDEEGCQFRVAKVLTPTETWVWVCAWETSKGPRIGCYSYVSADAAKISMENIAAIKDKL